MTRTANATAIAPRNASSLSNRVINAHVHDADVQINIQNKSNDSESRSQNEGFLVDNTAAEDVNRAPSKECQATWWGEAIQQNMGLSGGYSKVAVLLIKWADELDELQTGQEARELDTLFRERFHYHTKTVELNIRRKPQLQLDNHISNFIYEHDGENSLLIVYYTGHGEFDDDSKTLWLTGSLNPAEGGGFRKDARVTWNKTEEQLRHTDVEGDVLTILDTCYASNLVKSSREDEKKFELLSACAINQTTAAPGPNSYTRALIDAVKFLLEDDANRPISTFSLTNQINKDSRRSDTTSHLWGRNYVARANQEHIFLSPLKPEKVDAPHQARRRPKGYLTLRFALRDASLDKIQIDYMAKQLSKALGNRPRIGLRKIDWVDMQPAPPMSHFERVTSVMRVIGQWKRVIAKNKEQAESQKAVDKVVFAQTESMTGSQKRVHEDTDEVRDRKRQYLDISHPPSPPVSECSRMDFET